MPDHEGCHRTYQPTRRAKGREIRSWRWKHKLSLLYAPLHTLPWLVRVSFATDYKNESWNHWTYKPAKSLDTALQPQGSPQQPCVLCPGQQLCLWAAEPSVKVCREGTCPGEGSHTVGLSLIFPSNGNKSTAHPVIETLFSPSGYYQPNRCGPKSPAALQDVRDLRARTSLGISPWGIRAILGRTKTLGFLPNLTLQVTWCILLLTSTSTLIFTSSLPAVLCKPSLISCQALQTYPLPSLTAWCQEPTAPCPLEGARLKKYKVTMDLH